MNRQKYWKDIKYSYMWKFTIMLIVISMIIVGLNVLAKPNEMSDSEPDLEIDRISGGFGIHTVITNVGDAAAHEVTWRSTVTGDLVFRGDEIFPPKPVVPVLNPGDSIAVSSWKYDYIFGFGNVQITVSTDCDEQASDQKTQDGFLLGPYVGIS